MAMLLTDGQGLKILIKQVIQIKSFRSTISKYENSLKEKILLMDKIEKKPDRLLLQVVRIKTR